ncbi:hypothetical protein JAAARDRAFT_195848 [Jaapia argillacea MUCL 33604]|uniref:Uncharacterized protein n=1 Tax=Jaapia argillacea MUCL 33604 TaxID=933084 RepID=A0A067PKR9_9AGAM|nr:hypothetical protein JAAARDRAFT_195848 [Jaapia argillacea MUCL 33604]
MSYSTAYNFNTTPTQISLRSFDTTTRQEVLAGDHDNLSMNDFSQLLRPIPSPSGALKPHNSALYESMTVPSSAAHAPYAFTFSAPLRSSQSNETPTPYTGPVGYPAAKPSADFKPAFLELSQASFRPKAKFVIDDVLGMPMPHSLLHRYHNTLLFTALPLLPPYPTPTQSPSPPTPPRPRSERSHRVDQSTPTTAHRDGSPSLILAHGDASVSTAPKRRGRSAASEGCVPSYPSPPLSEIQGRASHSASPSPSSEGDVDDDGTLHSAQSTSNKKRKRGSANYAELFDTLSFPCEWGGECSHVFIKSDANLREEIGNHLKAVHNLETSSKLQVVCQWEGCSVKTQGMRKHIATVHLHAEIWQCRCEQWIGRHDEATRHGVNCAEGAAIRAGRKTALRGCPKKSARITPRTNDEGAAICAGRKTALRGCPKKSARIALRTNGQEPRKKRARRSRS